MPSNCVSGMDFVYKNGSVFLTGFTGSQTATLDLTNKQMYSITSFCGDICDTIKLCTIDLVTSEIACIITGISGNPLSLFADISEYCVYGFYGDFKTHLGDNCINSLGIFYLN